MQIRIANPLPLIGSTAPDPRQAPRAPAAAPAGPPAAQAAAPAAPARSFSSVMRQKMPAPVPSARSEAAAPARPDAAPAEAAPEADDAAPPASEASAPGGIARGRGPEKRATGEARPARPTAQKPAGDGSDAAARADDAEPRHPGEARDTGLVAWFGEWRPPPAVAASVALGPRADRSVTSGSDGDAATVASLERAGLGTASDRSTGSPDAAPSGAESTAAATLDPARQVAGGAAASAQAPFAEALARASEDPRHEGRAEPSGDAASINLPAAFATLAAPGVPTSPAPEAAPTQAAVATPLDSPDFPRMLGVQVSALATDGVQRAELHLNPAEMGPVSVEIVLDGTSARVDFGADLAATRHVIEAGLPELAGALRDAGFTLAGGGVSDHARGGSGDATSRGPSNPPASRTGDGAGEADRIAAAATPRRTSLTASGLDLYA